MSTDLRTLFVAVFLTSFLAACSSLTILGGGSGNNYFENEKDLPWEVREGRPTAFPGAQGWGAGTPGGRGGQIVFVTSLGDTGPGTLREALLGYSVPRMILFRVGGVIRLETPIWLSEEPGSYVTIAGQSAPGGGIAITNNPIYFANGVHDVQVRHIRFRSAGAGPSVHSGSRGIIFDHCSFAWAWDENLDLFGDVAYITISNSIFAEGLRYGDHPDGGHSMGLLIGKGADRVSIHHSMFMSNDSRNPLIEGGDYEPWRGTYALNPLIDFRNNLIYNNLGGNLSAIMGTHINVVGNAFIYGPSTIPHIGEVQFGNVNDDEMRNDGNRFYTSDNIGPNVDAHNSFSVIYEEITQTHAPNPDLFQLTEPIAAPMVTTSPASLVAEQVLDHAGALPHDEADARFMQEFRNGTGESGAPSRRRDSPFAAPAPGTAEADDDRDGMPNAWEQVEGLDPASASDAWDDEDQDGYKNLEEFLAGSSPHRVDQ